MIAPLQRNPLRVQQQAILGDTAPLPDAAGLYVITVFSNGEKHLRRVHVRDTEVEIDGLTGQVQAEVDAGAYRDPQILLKHTRGVTKEKISGWLAQGMISQQTVRKFYPIPATYHRPQMVPLSALREQGFVIE